MSNTETITRLEARICELEEKLEFYEVGNEAFKTVIDILTKEVTSLQYKVAVQESTLNFLMDAPHPNA